MTLNVVKFPDHYAALNVPESLRALADEIEAGEHGACNSLLWVIDAGDGEINLGLMGRVPDPSGTALILAAVVPKKILAGIGE